MLDRSQKPEARSRKPEQPYSGSWLLGPGFLDRIVVVAAHPDDETIGAGGQLASMAGVALIHVTDGAPRTRPDWKSYARARRDELLSAAAIAGIPERCCLELGIADQEASMHLVELTCALARLFETLGPAVILTHPYEGGHPDHDATAFAVRHAVGMVAVRPELWEFTSYHRGPCDSMETGAFLPLPGGEIFRAALTEKERCRKRRMLACFASQSETLAPFRVDDEIFRPAPEYDFSAPPHDGPLFYDSFEWGVTGTEWLRQAAHAWRSLIVYNHSS